MKLIKLTNTHDKGDPAIRVNTDRIVTIEAMKDGGSWLFFDDDRKVGRNERNSLIVTESPEQIAAMIEGAEIPDYYALKIDDWKEFREMGEDKVRRIVSEAVNLWLAEKKYRSRTVTMQTPMGEVLQARLEIDTILDRIETGKK